MNNWLQDEHEVVCHKLMVIKIEISLFSAEFLADRNAW